MNQHSAATSSLNGTGYEGDALHLQMVLEEALFTSKLSAIQAALHDGADLLAYPVGRLRDAWIGDTNPNLGMRLADPLVSHRCTLLGHVMLGIPGEATDELFSAVLGSVRINGADPGKGLWAHAPAAIADKFNAEVSAVSFLVSRDNFGRMARARPQLAGNHMLETLLRRLDVGSRHMQWELGEAASHALARSMDAVHVVRHKSQRDERSTPGYNAFGLLATSGASISDHVLNQTIEIGESAWGGRLPLLMAASMPHPMSLRLSWTTHDLLRRLIDAGAKVDTRYGKGRTALMCASWQGDKEAVAILLGSGANPDLRDIRNWSALSYAKNSKSKQRDEVLALLTAHKAHRALHNIRTAFGAAIEGRQP